ncbi:hypothetical protein [Amycolatopsis echigonensis]|nr:hypothetical protein [Amycolatopsis niigatensis]
MSFKMLSDTQKQAMLTASVDRSKIKDGADKVEIPASAVKASVKFAKSDIATWLWRSAAANGT